MKRKIDKALNIYLLLALLVSAVQSAQAGGLNYSALLCLVNSQGSETEWQRVSPQGEEFSILTPAPPTFMKYDASSLLRDYEEKILEHRYYSAYAADFIFVIESYKAARPQRLLKDLGENSSQGLTLEREVTISGVSGKQYRFETTNYYKEKLTFVTKQHVYLITLAARDENDASLAKFLSSLMLGDKISAPVTGDALNVKESEAYKNALANASGAVQPEGQALSPKNVSRKAMIVTRPEPTYTDDARQMQLTGTVVLRGIFDADGQVKNIRVVSGLGGGLTEKAIEAALSIRYFPAEKDGQRVSQYIQIEYNFNLY